MSPWPSPVSPRATLLLTVVLLAACAPPPRSQPRPSLPPLPATPEEELGEGPLILEEVVRAPKRDILGSVTYDLPVEANSWVEAELDFLVGQRSAVIGKWLARGDAYEAYIKAMLRANGLPTDLFHLAMIESGFIPTARSRAGAVGLWQFMPGTARGYGLRVDEEIDERMDPVRSTRAAMRHLRSLYGSLGDWALAAAAYNAGSGRIRRAMQAYSVDNFWDLAQQADLAEETKQYVPRLYAVTVIARDRTRFGFPPPESAPAFSYDSVQVEYATPLDVLAGLGEVTPEELAALNPHLRARTTPAGGYWVWVPQGRGVEMQRAWLASEFRKEQGHGTYTVRWGDNLGLLARRSGLKARRIRELNPEVDFDRLKVGETLKLPYRVAQELSARPATDQKQAPVAARSEAPEERPKESKESRTDGNGDGAGREVSGSRTHSVQPGETLWAIARRHEVSVDAIRKANDLEGSTIRPGQVLRIPGTAAAEKTLETVDYVVRAGDTLWGIAREHGTTIDAIRQANQLGDRPIRPGQKLRIPKGG